jgi:hypothetical protein
VKHGYSYCNPLLKIVLVLVLAILFIGDNGIAIANTFFSIVNNPGGNVNSIVNNYVCNLAEVYFQRQVLFANWFPLERVR